MPELATDPSGGLTWDLGVTDVLVAHQRAIAHHTAGLQAVVAQMLQRIEPAYRRYVADEVALALRLSPGQARNLVDEVELVQSVPALWALMGDGTLSAQHARAISSQLACLALSDPDDVQAVLDLVLPKVPGRTPHQLAQLVDAACLTLDLEVAERRRTKTRADRDVTSFPTGDSGAALMAHGPVERIAEMVASLDSLTWPRHPDDDRTAAQRRFDALHQLVCGGLQPGQWEAQVVVSLQSLLGTSTELAELPGLGKVLPSVARDLLAHAGMRRLVVDETGQLLDLGDQVHQPPGRPVGQSSQGGGPTGSRTQTRRPTADAEPPESDVPDEQPLDAADLAWWYRQRIVDGERVADEPAGAEPADVEPADVEPAERDLHDIDPIDLLSAYEQDRQREAELRRDQQWARREGVSLTKAQLLVPDPDLLDPDLLAADVLGATRRPWWTAVALGTALTRIGSDPFRPRDLAAGGYTPPPRLKRFLVARDRTCVFPGCRRKAQHADKDHVVPWPRGSTTAMNLASECPHHHRAKHHHFTLTGLPSGGLRWRTPAGRSYDVPPCTLLR